MSVFTCIGCGRKLRLKTKLVGKKFPCPLCGHLLMLARRTSVSAEQINDERKNALAAEAPTIPPNAEANREALANEAATVAASNRSEEDTTAARTVPPPIPAGNSAKLSKNLDGYEIVGELGRGGMGVVYQARQVGLKRLVALKMILSGVHAGPQDLERFRLEAEAVARLQHPNIIQIHDIGERDGLPYFALEFVEGGSLADKLQAGQPSFKRAAQLMADLANAMHVAHKAGIIHRDLKPANVLLTNDGQPKITDFGLAKALDDTSGRTATGAIMGTPSYMAPEQAGGSTQKISPATDVYALGAILYELLTGRPPFRAATAMDTIMQVVSDDPVPPRQIDPEIPRDLETICLMCLRKDPGERYASAALLAEDLERFLDDEPIKGRRLNAIEKVTRWIKEQPGVAISVFSAFVMLLLLSSLFSGGLIWLGIASTTLALFLTVDWRVFLISSGIGAIVCGAAVFGLFRWNPDFVGRVIVAQRPHSAVVWLFYSEPEKFLNRRDRKVPGSNIRTPVYSAQQSQIAMVVWTISPLPESVGMLLWLRSRIVYALFLAVAGGLIIGTFVSFAVRQESWIMQAVFPLLLLIALGGGIYVGRSSFVLIGGVLLAVTVGVVSRAVSRWLARDLVAAVQGAVYGCVLGILVNIGFFIFFLSSRSPWPFQHPVLFTVVTLGLFLFCTTTATIRGAFTGKKLHAVAKN